MRQYSSFLQIYGRLAQVILIFMRALKVVMFIKEAVQAEIGQSAVQQSLMLVWVPLEVVVQIYLPAHMVPVSLHLLMQEIAGPE